MATYVYRCPSCGRVVEESRSIHDGPYPVPLCGADGIHDYAEMPVVIQTSAIEFGSMETGDDDFSRRYWPNGKNQASLPNRTQGTTNVNAIQRKWGPKGMPLEARTDIDVNHITNQPIPDWSNGNPGGMVPAHVAMTPAVTLPHTSDLK